MVSSYLYVCDTQNNNFYEILMDETYEVGLVATQNVPSTCFFMREVLPTYLKNNKT